MNEYILCAAIKLSVKENEPSVIVGGYRHKDCIESAIRLGYTHYISQNEQGFITSTGRFVDRKEAKNIARTAKQLIRDSNNEKLMSEDIYV